MQTVKCKSSYNGWLKASQIEDKLIAAIDRKYRNTPRQVKKPEREVQPC